MKMIQLTENTANAKTLQISVSSKVFKTLEAIQYEGGYLSFHLTLVDDKVKTDINSNDKTKLSEFLKSVFNYQPVK